MSYIDCQSKIFHNKNKKQKFMSATLKAVLIAAAGGLIAMVIYQLLVSKLINKFEEEFERA
jgi:hypothetical protein